MENLQAGRHSERYGWGEWVDRAAADSTPGTLGRSSRETDGGHSWDLGASFAQAIKLARDGWAQGEEHVKKYSTALFDKLASRVEREYPVYDVEGAGIDIARYVDGEPECWQRMEPVVTEGSGRRIIRVVYCGSASCGISAETMLARGAAVVALVQLLEMAGHGVQVDVVFGISERAEYWISVKASDQPFDLGRVAFAVAHPAMFRRLGFSVMEKSALPVQRMLGVGSGYGSPGDAQDRGDIYLPKMYWGGSEWTSPGAAEAWVLAELKRQGVNLGEEEGQ